MPLLRLLTLLLTLFLAAAHARADVKTNEVLSPEIRGQIVDKGVPVGNLRVRRSVYWAVENRLRVDLATTDANGHYRFPQVRGTAHFGILDYVGGNMGVSYRISVPSFAKYTTLYSGNRDSYSSADPGILHILSDLSNSRQISEDSIRVNTEVVGWPSPKKVITG